MERQGQVGPHLKKVARQHSDSAGLAVLVVLDRDTLGKAAEETVANTAAVESAAVESAAVDRTAVDRAAAVDRAVGKVGMHSCSRIPTRPQNGTKWPITAIVFESSRSQPHSRRSA